MHCTIKCYYNIKKNNIALLCLSVALGAAYGTAKSGTGIAAMSVMRPELIMKSIIPVVMAGIIAIYGLVVAVLIANNISDKISLYKYVFYTHLVCHIYINIKYGWYEVYC